jgi:hypothetical protein
LNAKYTGMPEPPVLNYLKTDVGAKYTVAIPKDGAGWFQDKRKSRMMYENDFEVSLI